MNWAVSGCSDNPWSWSHQHEARLWIDIGHGDARTAPSRDHYRDWTPSTINRVGIMETPFADQPQAVVPGVPGLPRAHGLGGDTISVRWWTPHSDGGSAITGYKVQWKEAGVDAFPGVGEGIPVGGAAALAAGRLRGTPGMHGRSSRRFRTPGTNRLRPGRQGPTRCPAASAPAEASPQQGRARTVVRCARLPAPDAATRPCRSRRRARFLPTSPAEGSIRSLVFPRRMRHTVQRDYAPKRDDPP